MRYNGALPDTSEHADAVTYYEPRVSTDFVRLTVNAAILYNVSFNTLVAI